MKYYVFVFVFVINVVNNIFSEDYLYTAYFRDDDNWKYLIVNYDNKFNPNINDIIDVKFRPITVHYDVFKRGDSLLWIYSHAATPDSQRNVNLRTPSGILEIATSDKYPIYPVFSKYIFDYYFFTIYGKSNKNELLFCYNENNKSIVSYDTKEQGVIINIWKYDNLLNTYMFTSIKNNKTLSGKFEIQNNKLVTLEVFDRTILEYDPETSSCVYISGSYYKTLIEQEKQTTSDAENTNIFVGNINDKIGIHLDFILQDQFFKYAYFINTNEVLICLREKHFSFKDFINLVLLIDDTKSNKYIYYRYNIQTKQINRIKTIPSNYELYFFTKVFPENQVKIHNNKFILDIPDL